MATALFTGGPSVAVGKPGDVHTVAKNPVGLRVQGFDSTGNIAEYIYLKGVTSTIVGSVVTYDQAGATLLIAANAVGLVAVATGITVGSTWGWYGICGVFLTDVVANSAAAGALGRETTDGKVGDGFAAGDQIFGALMGNVATTAAAVVLCQYMYPFVGNTA